MKRCSGLCGGQYKEEELKIISIDTDKIPYRHDRVGPVCESCRRKFAYALFSVVNIIVNYDANQTNNR